MINQEMLNRAAAEGKQRISVTDLQPKNYDWILAIDPNCSIKSAKDNKSGVALLNTATRYLDVHMLSFPRLVEWFTKAKTEFGSSILILIEGGWLNKSNWHLKRSTTKEAAASMGKDVGRNHQTGILLAEMAKHYGLNVEIIKPITKIWNTKDGKCPHDELQKFVDNLPSETNQDERDAILLAYHRAGFPLHEDPRREFERIILHNNG